MTQIFVNEFLLVGTATAVPLRFVETMTFVKDEEDLAVDKLKNDKTFYIVTLSGREYEVSVRRQLTPGWQERADLNLDDWLEAIYRNWKHVLTGKS